MHPRISAYRIAGEMLRDRAAITHSFGDRQGRLEQPEPSANDFSLNYFAAIYIHGVPAQTLSLQTNAATHIQYTGDT